MECTFSELMNMEVISTVTGARLGFIDDIVLDTESCLVQSFIIRGRPRLGGIMGKEEDIYIPCTYIDKIGSDTVLVRIGDLSELHKN